MSNYQNDYVDVAERIRQFRSAHPTGSLQPANPAEPFSVITIGERTFIAYVAAAYRSPDDVLPGIGCAWEPIPGPTPFTRDSELMNAETSAWGRAIVAALAADTKKVASMDEVNARRQENARREAQSIGHPAAEPRQSAPEAPQDASNWQGTNTEPHITEGQERAIYAISKALGKPTPGNYKNFTKRHAGDVIEKLKQEQEAKAAPARPVEQYEPAEEPF